MKKIIKSIPMILFIITVLGLVTIVSYFDAKKDLKQPASNQVNQSYKQNNFR